MAKKEEEILKESIGNMGNEPIEEKNPLEGQKLKYDPNGANKIDKDDPELRAFLERSHRNSRFNQGGEDGEKEMGVFMSSRGMGEGWIPINRDEMGIRSKFYPEDWVFMIRPATVEAIKNWSALDEDRLDVVNAVFNDIIRTCFCIKSDTQNIAWSKMNSWDRFWFVMKIREYTFSSGEAKVEFTDTCPECEQEIIYTLTPKSLFYEFPDDDIVDKHWNSMERVWYIDPKDYDVEGPVVKLYVPTLEKDQAILDWAIERQRNNKKIDEVFLRFLPWMLSKAPKDPGVLDKFIGECEMKYKSWDVEMFNFMDDVVRNITINPSEKLKQVCPHCGEEVVSNVRFPNGIKTLFKTQIKHKKFGSR